MKITDTRVFKGKNIYSLKKCIKLIVDLDGYSEIPSKEIEDFNENLLNMIPELYEHRCGIDEDQGFVKRLKEGTYLAHVLEHMIIGIHNKIGIDVSYGKAREINGDIYYIIFQYEYEKTAIEITKLSIDIINSLINKNTINYDERILILKDVLRKEMIGPSTGAICSYAKSIGLPIIRLGEGNFYQIGYGKQGRIIEASIGSQTNCVSVDISCDKALTKEILESQSIPVAKGNLVNNLIDLLKKGEDIGYPVVLKPQYGNQGKGVILNIKNEKELLSSYRDVINDYKEVLIEKYHTGDDYRVLVVNYKVIAVSLRRPPYIIGDGESTIKDLIYKENENPKRGEDHEKSLTKIRIDNEVIQCLKEQGKNINTIIEKNKKIYIRRNANLSTGGEALDCTDKICIDNIKICERAAKALKLDICGIDICSNDISTPLKENHGIIMEINSAPGLRMHISPSEGNAIDVGKAIVNMLYENEPANIPVISVTGTNGKTTTTRIISHTLTKMGYKVGMTSTSGIFIGEECIDEGDDTGFESTKAVLLNPEVEVAVLETARGGMIRKGLAYDESDVAVITNIAEDHLGLDGINTIEELSFVKSLVGEAVKEDGYVVLNAEDKNIEKIIKRIKANKIFFSKSINNKLIKQNINKSICIFVKDKEIIVSNKGREYKVCSIDDIPITLNGNLEFNIENSLAACGALVGMGIDYAMIKNGLTSYKLNSKQNCGRFNIYDVYGVNVILDYGHNPEGYITVLKSLKKITDSKIYGIVGIPGDRSDEMALKIGEISSDFLDYTIIKEDRDLRGRKEKEISKLIEKGIKKTPSKKYEIILKEEEALIRALELAKEGEYIILFFEDHDTLLKIIKEYKKTTIELKA